VTAPLHGSLAGASLRAFVARVVGWTDTTAIEHALRSIDLATNHRAVLVLAGDRDTTPIAAALHRRTLGPSAPFVTVNPRRLNADASIRSPANRTHGVDAVRAAAGGSLCLDRIRLPRDYPAMVALVRDPISDVLLIVCTEASYAMDPLVILPAPIVIPPLRARAGELPRIVAEYAADAIARLGADESAFTDRDQTWVLDHAARTLREIEVATMRLVALRQEGSVNRAARLLKQSHVSLARWLGRRRGGQS
jgi:hypothetical protein